MLYELAAGHKNQIQSKPEGSSLKMGSGHRRSRKSQAPQKSTIKLSLLKTLNSQDTIPCHCHKRKERATTEW